MPGAPWLGVACAAGLVTVNTALVRRRPALFGVLTWAGSGLLLFGNIAWAVGRPIFDVVPNWIAFLVLTIVGERLRWSRAAVVPRWATHVLALLTTAFGLAAFMRMLGVGAASQVLGATALLLAVWQIRFDIARHALAQSGSSQYIALGVLAGMAWLAFAGSLFVLRPLPPAGPLYDAMLHAVLVGYVFSTLFAHAPTMLSAVAAIHVPFTRYLHVPLVLLHASLGARVAGDLSDVLALRRVGAIGNAVALAVFVITVLGVTLARESDGARRATESA